MKTMLNFFLAAAGAATFAACAAPAGHAPANDAYANAATPVAAAPTADALLALETQSIEAYIKGDAKFFEGMLSDQFTMVGGGQRMDKTTAAKVIGGVTCDIKDGWKPEDPQVVMIEADTYVVSYTSKMEGTCTSDGHTERMDRPMRAASVYIRRGDTWAAVFHGENAIVDPTAPPPTPAKADAKMDEKVASYSNAARAGAPIEAKSALTDALLAVETSVWEAWKAHDAKKIESLTTGAITFVNIFGTYLGNKADVIKDWTGAACEAKSFSLTDGVGRAVSPTVGILTLQGSVDGTCGGQRPGPIYTTSVYVKDGASWKLAFGFNSPA